MKKVAIVGVGTVPWRSRYEDKTWLALGFEAVKNALADARLAKEDIDMAIYSCFCELMLRQQIMSYIIHEYLGLEAKPSLRTNAAGAADIAALYAGFCEVASGMSDIVLILAIQKGQDLVRSALHDQHARQGPVLVLALVVELVLWLQP